MPYGAGHGAGRPLSRLASLSKRSSALSVKLRPWSYRRSESSRTTSKVIFSGIQPTGVPHVGNYLGALQQWKKLQDEACPSSRLLYSIADLHAITVQQDPGQLREWKRETLAALLAIGLDPERCTIFYQSAVAEHAELMWILSCMAPVGHLRRMTQWKSKLSCSENASPLEAGAAKAKLRLGLFSYPVLQAADVLLYGATHVPVGEDQVQHLEFTRDCVDAFNAFYGEVLRKPQIILSPAKRVMSLKEPYRKMSKSHKDNRSRINIDDSTEEISIKIKLALTDSIDGLTYEPESRPGVANLLELMSHFDSEARSAALLARSLHPMSMRDFKAHVITTVTDGLATIRERYHRLIASHNAHYLADIADHGRVEARKQAESTMATVREAIGLR